MTALSTAPPVSRPEGSVKADTGAPRISSATLLAGSREIIVEHRGDDYRLRLTSNGKLILTK